MVREVKNLGEFQAILKDAGDKLVVVDFTATWCGPCQMISPAFRQLAADPANANVVFLKVDVDDAADLSASCEIRCMPTFQFYKNNQKVHEFSGGHREKLIQTVAELR